MIYVMHDYMNTLTVDCKYTLVGKFSNTMTNMELIIMSSIQQTKISVCGGGGGGVHIAHYNSRHVFIDLKNELDYNRIWTQ